MGGICLSKLMESWDTEEIGLSVCTTGIDIQYIMITIHYIFTPDEKQSGIWYI
jgi:hypothetical protein